MTKSFTAWLIVVLTRLFKQLRMNRLVQLIKNESIKISLPGLSLTAGLLADHVPAGQAKREAAE